MKISIIGAGPAGLYAAILIRQLRADIDLELIEQNPAQATFGFGVVFSDQALGFLAADDPASVALIEPHMKRWSNIVVVHRRERIEIDGIGFAAIGRLQLLQLLQQRAYELGVQCFFNRPFDNLRALHKSDLVIGADGLNSLVRAQNPGAYGVSQNYLQNRFVWYGAKREFDALTQTFVESPYGPMNAHHYSYMPGNSTFIIEMSPQTFARGGFESMPEPQYRKICADCFADTLDGAALTPNHSIWRRFPILSCQRWYHGKHVLVGDALHSAHFSIGSGTRLALEDVVALVKTLRDNEWEVASALPAYQASRQPVLDKLTTAAAASANWYENFAQHMRLDPWRFALSYLYRAGRIDAVRLHRIAPDFCHQLEQRGISLEPQ